MNYKLLAEKAFFKHFITEVYPSGVASYVSDTYDFWGVITEVASWAKPYILSRQPNAIGLAKTVFRPDSGDPVEILCGIEIKQAVSAEDAAEYIYDRVCNETAYGEMGDWEADDIFLINGKHVKVSISIDWNRYDNKQYYYPDGWEIKNVEEVQLTPQQKGAVECLWDIFGGTITDKGYKLLDSHVGLIYGDSITLDRANEILRRLFAKGFASGNVVFGIGSFTYQYNTRDTFGMAMKATYAVVNGKSRELFKEPKTDSGVKKSAKGLLRVEFDAESNNYVLYDQQTLTEEVGGLLQTVFEDGKLVNETTLGEIRSRLESELTRIGVKQ